MKSLSDMTQIGWSYKNKSNGTFLQLTSMISERLSI